MSICNNCPKANLVPLCVTNLTLGTITSLNTAVDVYQEHVGSGRLTVYKDVTSDAGTGAVTIQPTNIMAQQEYDYWVVLDSATGIEAKEDLTISGTAYECVTVEYALVVDNADDAPETYTNITLDT